MPEETWTEKPASSGGGGSEREEPAEVTEPMMEEGEQAIFLKHESWNPASVWVWNETKNFTGGKWPGQSMTYLGNNVYKWTYTVEGEIPADALIIFSNKGNDQVPGSNQGGFKFVNGGYYTVNGYVKTIEAVSDEARVSVSPNGGEFIGTQEVTLKANANCTSASYKIGNGAETNLSGSTTVTIGEGMNDGESVTITWTATGANGTNTGSATFKKVAKPTNITVFYDNSVTNWSSVNIHYWGCSEPTNWPGVPMTKVNDNIWTFSVPADATGIIFCNNAGSDQTNDITGTKIVNNHVYKGTGNRGWEDLGENPATGISSVAAPSKGVVTYYNLMGMEVKKPVHGVYIVKRGNKMTKVYLK